MVGLEAVFSEKMILSLAISGSSPPLNHDQFPPEWIQRVKSLNLSYCDWLTDEMVQVDVTPIYPESVSR